MLGRKVQVVLYNKDEIKQKKSKKEKKKAQKLFDDNKRK